MDLQKQFPTVHYIWGGAISHVYEVHPLIVLKVPGTGDYDVEQFKNELKIYDILSRHPPCPFIVQCFHCAENGIFLEYMKNEVLALRIQNNHTRDHKTMVVTEVKKLEPLGLRQQWMTDLAGATAFLESLNLAHGDLRPENILLDGDKVKLCDFDWTREFGEEYWTCEAPYGRFLNKGEEEAGEGTCGHGGNLCVRTELFALGSLYYLINYGFEVYGDRCVSEDPEGRGAAVESLLQNMQFPELNGDPVMDAIIDKCWHNKYPTIADLAAELERLFDGEGTKVSTASEEHHRVEASGDGETTIDAAVAEDTAGKSSEAGPSEAGSSEAGSTESGASEAGSTDTETELSENASLEHCHLDEGHLKESHLEEGFLEKGDVDEHHLEKRRRLQEGHLEQDHLDKGHLEEVLLDQDPREKEPPKNALAEIKTHEEGLVSAGTNAPEAALGEETGKSNADEGVEEDEGYASTSRPPSMDESGALKGDFSALKAICQDLVARGLLDALSSVEPKDLGFSVEWYRYHKG
ncbi:uncharacterized protein DSM5745_07869 [Aspergillus mulundensis]|uniref:Protein kinase domain-containing protein n=1 Tax=Aspergillus mulundensis TaxID=1810919 RepID=A0A3D8RF84_9EURO|nr:hypothetical protein DSM5745_07869 [Aspergillus mulundensis]RDW72697.1 hypothetical protein DSM5745_07869 [Aspergillus mulundensis]